MVDVPIGSALGPGDGCRGMRRGEILGRLCGDASTWPNAPLLIRKGWGSSPSQELVSRFRCVREKNPPANHARVAKIALLGSPSASTARAAPTDRTGSAHTHLRWPLNQSSVITLPQACASCPRLHCWRLLKLFGLAWHGGCLGLEPRQAAPSLILGAALPFPVVIGGPAPGGCCCGPAACCAAADAAEACS